MTFFTNVVVAMNAQCIGHEGEYFCVSYAVSTEKKLIESGQIICNPDNARAASTNCPIHDKVWVRMCKKGVISRLPKDDGIHVETPHDLYEKVWEIWTSLLNSYGKTLRCIGFRDYPFLTNLFEKCVLLERDSRKIIAPTPIYNLKSLLKTTGCAFDYTKKTEIEKAINCTELYWKSQSILFDGKIPERIYVKPPEYVFSFDVERWGLYGKPFWIGYSIFENQCEIETGSLFCPHANAKTDGLDPDDVLWVNNHVIPHFPKEETPYKTPNDILGAFGEILRHWMKKKNCIFLGKRIYPIETSTLRESYNLTRPKGDKSTPRIIFIDVQSELEVLRLSERAYPRSHSQKQHDPVGDSKYAAMLHFITQNKFQEILEPGPTLVTGWL
ncbi:MAG: hypothetical protein K940chlam3_00557 [Chlamydiae bacterium]|nr:hypothetical protein [Chlamydiota bacterium]